MHTKLRCRSHVCRHIWVQVERRLGEARSTVLGLATLVVAEHLLMLLLHQELLVHPVLETLLVLRAEGRGHLLL